MFGSHSFLLGTSGQGTGGETNDGVHGLEETRSSVVPGQQRGNDTETTSDLGHNVTSGQVTQVTRGQEAEGQGQDEEHGRQRHRGSQGRDPEHEGEDGPADQEDAECVIQGVIRGTSVTGNNTESWDQDRGVCQPEGTVGANCVVQKKRGRERENSDKR